MLLLYLIYIYMLITSGVRRKFSRRRPSFRHNYVTSQINFMGSAKGTTILEWSGGMSRENFAKLHLKIRIFVHSGNKFQCNAFSRLIRRMKS